MFNNYKQERYIDHFSFKKATSEKILNFGIFLIFVLLFSRDFIGIDYNKFFLVGIVALIGCFLSYSDLIVFSAFLVPLSCGMPNNYNFMILLILLCLKKDNCNIFQLIFPLIIVAQEWILALFTLNQDFFELIAYSINLFLTLFLILDNSSQKIDYKKVVLYFLYSTSFMLSMIFLISVKQYSLSKILLGGYRIGVTKTEDVSILKLSTNANTIGFYALLSVSICLYFLKTTKLKLSIIALLLLNGVIGLFSLSRSYLLFLLIVLFLFLLTEKKLNFNRLIFMIGSIFILGCLFYLLNTKTDIFSAYLERFLDSDVTTGNKRTEIMMEYFNWLFNRPLRLLFGTGVHNHLETTGLVATHNGIQQIMVCYGVIGLVIFAFVFIKAFYFAKKGRCEFVTYLPLLAIFLFVQTVQYLDPYEYFMSSIVGFYAIRAIGARS